VLLELDGVGPDPHVFVLEIAGEVLVDAVPGGFRVRDDPEDARLAVADMNRVGQQIEDREVVFHDQHRAVPLRGDLPDEPGGRDPLADVEVRRHLVEEVEVGIAGEGRRQGDPLELAPGQGVDGLIDDRPDGQPVDDLLERVAFVGPLQELPGDPVELVRDVIDVLRLARDADRLVAERPDVVLELGAAELIADGLPPWRVVEPAEIRGELAGEDLDRGGFPDPVRTEQPGHAAVLGHRQAVELEGVLAEAVGRLVVEGLREVDDLDRVERTLHDTDPAGLPEADLLGDAHLRRLALVFAVLAMALLAGNDALLAGPVRRTEIGALVVTPVGLTVVQIDDRDAVPRHGYREAPVWSRMVQVTNQREKVMKAT